MVIGLIDIIVLITLVLSVLFALYRGLVCELLGISSWILAGFGALYGYSPMQKVMSHFIDNEKIAGLAGAALIALLILIIMTIINAHITSRLRQSSLSGLDRILGLVFGVLRAFLLIALIYIGASMLLSEKQIASLSKENISVPYIQKMARFLGKFVPQNMQKDLDVYEQGGLNEQKPPKIGRDLKRHQPLPSQSNKKALNSLIKEISKPQTTKNTAKGQKETVKKLPDKKKVISPVSKDNQPTAIEYNESERKSLDNMVEQLTEGK